MTETTPAKRGRPALQTPADGAYLAWQRAVEQIDNMETTLREELERRTALTKIDAQAALARFKVFGGKVDKDGRPVLDDGTPYVITRERKPAEK